MKPIAATMLGLALAACGKAEDPRAAEVDAVFADIKSDGPGCAVGMYRAGELVLAKGYGLASLEDRRPISPRTTFDLGSAAKPFTALATLMLADQGKLALDDDVRRYLPELPDYGTPIRIRDLLQHTSGFRDYGTIGLLVGQEITTMPEFLSRMATHRLNFTPGTRHEYSHSDFHFLALVIERVTGEPFGAYLEREVLKPLGMTGTRVHDARGGPVADRALGHKKSAAGYSVIFPGSEMTGGSNLYTSVEDLRHWDRALEEAGGGSRPLVAQMLTRPTLPNGDTIPYAFGIRRGNYRGLPVLTRGGHPPGMRGEWVRFPGQRFGVAVLCNADHLYSGRLADRVADLYLRDSLQPRRPRAAVPPAVPITLEELQHFAGSYRSEALDLARFVIVDGKLAELLADTLQTMTHLGGGEFFGDGSPGDFRVRFKQPASGGPVRLEYVVEGEVDGTAERVPDAELWRPDAAALAGYAGTYSSEELGVVWRLVVRDAKLMLQRSGSPDVALLPHRSDVFTRGLGFWAEPLIVRFQFSRNPSGRITQFTITTPPGDDVVRDLRFVRVP